MQSYLAKKFVCIPNFVDLDQFKADIEINSDRLVVLYPRRLYEPRGFWLVKEIIPEFVKRYPNIEFQFVGQAEPDAEVAVQELVRIYPENVRWYTLSFDEMPSAYQGANITLIPTINSEGTSLSCLEAMAAGNAVIASNVGGLPDLIISGHNGILMDPTVSGLRDALDLLCKDREMRQVLGNQAQSVATTFNINKWQSSWKKLLKEFLL
jgi:glycosyltransferase involved in cell wall biosynthesis